MTGPYVPPEPPSSPPGAPSKSGPPWGKIVLFGCLGLLVIGLVITGIAVAVYMMRDAPAVVDVPDTGITTPTPGTTTTPGTVATPAGALSGAYEVRTGNLGAGDAMAQDGSWYDPYPMSYPVGATITATLRSTDFDAYITVLSPSGSPYSDDDSGGGTDSQVTVTINEGGTWNVWANTLRTGDTGAYTLTVETSP